MGLVAAFVTGIHARAVLAVAAIAVSVAYSLVAGAAVTGLQDAQTSLAAGLQETYLVVTRPDLEPFASDDVPFQALTRLAAHATANGTMVVVRGGTAGLLLENESLVHAGPATGYDVGDRAPFANRTVNATTLPLGARPDWFLVSPAAFEEQGGPAPPVIHVVVLRNLTDAQRAALEADGFDVVRAPAALPFYEGGALELVSGVRATVLASTLVVGLLATAFVSMELEANRKSFATLRLYAGATPVAGLVAARGIVLLLAGHAVALAGTAALLLLLSRGGAGRFTLEPNFIRFALGATLLGGTLGLVPPILRASKPLAASELQDRGASAPRQSVLRPLLARGRTVLPLLVAAAVLAGSMGVLFGVVDMPAQLFGAEGVEVATGVSPNPLRGTVSAFLGEHLGEVEGFDEASPEIFAPTVVDGRPVMVRGVSWGALVRFDDVRLVRGGPPTHPGDAVLGARLADAIGGRVGERLLVPASYLASSLELRVVGIADAPGLLADEVLVTLDTARLLTGLGPDDANIVRYRFEADAVRPGVGGPELPDGLAVTRMTIVPAKPLPDDEATAELRLVNFAAEPRTRSLTLRINGLPTSDAWSTLGAHEQATVALPFRVPTSGVFVVDVNPTASVEPAATPYRLETPGVVVAGDELAVRVFRTPPGVPVGGVTVRLDGNEAVTDDEGRAGVRSASPGNRTVEMEGPDGRALGRVLVVAPDDVDRARLVVVRLAGPPVATGAWNGVVTLENVGGRFHSGAFPLRIDGVPTNVSDAFLQAGQTARVELALELPLGRHRVGEGDRALDIEIVPEGGAAGAAQPPPQEAKSIDELLQERRERALERGAPRRDATTAFLGETFENLNAALTVVVLATVLHAALITLVAVHRDVEERSGNVGTLAAIGADRAALRRLALRDFALLGAVAAALGSLLGLAAALAAANEHFLRGFGHALEPAHGVEFGARVAVAAFATTVLAAVLAVERIRGRLMRDLLAGGPARAARAPLRELTRGAP